MADTACRKADAPTMGQLLDAVLWHVRRLTPDDLADEDIPPSVIDVSTRGKAGIVTSSAMVLRR